MKGYENRRGQSSGKMETEHVLDEFDEVCSGRHRDTAEERASKIARLKAEVNSGQYKPDVMDIARLLTSAMDPTL